MSESGHEQTDTTGLGENKTRTAAAASGSSGRGGRGGEGVGEHCRAMTDAHSSSSATMAVSEDDVTELCRMGIGAVKTMIRPDTTRIGKAFDAMLDRVKVGVILGCTLYLPFVIIVGGMSYNGQAR